MRASRPDLYPLVAGMAVGALLVGLVVPLAVDETGSSARSAGPITRVGDSPTASERGSDRSTLDANGSVSEVETIEGGSGVATADETPPPSGSAAEAGPTEQADARRASDVGISPTTIKVGVVLLDLDTISAVGLAPENYGEEDQRKAYQAQIDAINAATGVHGRKIEAAYATADPLNPDTALAACTKLTEDERAFAVMAFGGYSADGTLCIGRQHKTPIVVFGSSPEELFRLTEGRLVTDGMQTTRMMFNWVHELDRLDMLTDKKVGIVGSENSSNIGEKQAVEVGLLPALRTYKYDVTYRTRLSADFHTAAGQMPVEVQRMRAAGVDTVMLPINVLSATQWVQAAEGQGWRPRYYVSDFGTMTCDVCAEAMPSSFHGAIGFTDRHFVRGARDGMPEPAVDRHCRETYNEATGENWRYGARHPLYNTCVQVEILKRTLTAAGVNPTRASWVANVPTIGAFPLPTAFGGGLSGKNDYSDMLVTVRWDASCTDSPRTNEAEDGCYRTVDQPRRVRY